MKILQIGLGSMGKRRIRNFQYLGFNDIVGFDTRLDRIKEAKDLYHIDTVESLDLVDFDAITHVIVSTPPDAHVGYARLALERDKHVFVEASVVDDGYEELLKLSKSKNVLLAPSKTMRFDPLNVKVKQVLDSNQLGKKIFAQHHFGLYLPFWHPYESIKDFYVSKKATGAAREIVPFDLVYISWLVGKPEGEVAGLFSKTGVLDVDIDDIYSLQYKTKDGCHVQFSIDVVSKKPYRDTKIVCEHGSIEINTVKGELSIYSADKNTWELYNRAQLSETKSTEEMYVIEIRSFVNSTLGNEKWNFSLEDDWEVLKWLYSAESSMGKSDD